jgi:hypothetical protein
MNGLQLFLETSVQSPKTTYSHILIPIHHQQYENDTDERAQTPVHRILKSSVYQSSSSSFPCIFDSRCFSYSLVRISVEAIPYQPDLLQDWVALVRSHQQLVLPVVQGVESVCWRLSLLVLSREPEEGVFFQ